MRLDRETVRKMVGVLKSTGMGTGVRGGEARRELRWEDVGRECGVDFGDVSERMIARAMGEVGWRICRAKGK